MESNRDVIKAAAVARLKAALMAGADAGVPDAVRQCYYQHPLFASTLFSEAVRQWFGLSCDVRVVTQFIARTCGGAASVSGGLPRRESEALVRAALGEVALLDNVDPKVVNYPEIGIAVLSRLFSEWRPSFDNVEALFKRVNFVLAEACELSIQLAPAEDDWFAEGMHYSPFVFGATIGEEHKEG